jgi:hypothetical protein
VSAAAEPVRLALDGTVIVPQVCTLYKHPSDGWPAVVDAHHVIPESWWVHAGKPVASPLIRLCPTCHVNTHACIDGLIRGLDISRLPPRCRALAAQALAGAKDNGLTPAPTL